MKYFNETYEKILKKYKIKSSKLKLEFDCILASKKVEAIFDDLYTNGILSDILPEFLPCIDLDQKNVHHAHPVACRRLRGRYALAHLIRENLCTRAWQCVEARGA